jgi:hypothetical protein
MNWKKKKPLTKMITAWSKEPAQAQQISGHQYLVRYVGISHSDLSFQSSDDMAPKFRYKAQQ